MHQMPRASSLSRQHTGSPLSSQRCRNLLRILLVASYRPVKYRTEILRERDVPVFRSRIFPNRPLWHLLFQSEEKIALRIAASHALEARFLTARELQLGSQEIASDSFGDVVMLKERPPVHGKCALFM